MPINYPCTIGPNKEVLADIFKSEGCLLIFGDKMTVACLGSVRYFECQRLAACTHLDVFKQVSGIIQDKSDIPELVFCD